MRLACVPQNRSRRGFTLLEMLVVVALVVLLMTVLVQIFAAATGAISVSRAYQELDQSLRTIDGTIRRDLENTTTPFTPGTVDPINNLGYFEYGENAPADLKGEDTDDYLRFTTKALPGQPFVGRLAVPNPAFGGFQLITFTSEFAEVIYFVRDSKLYRRVLLIAPERRTSLVGAGPNAGGTFLVPALGGLVSWQCVNDISARPNTFGASSFSSAPIANSLGDLTNRENRYGSPRFCDDFWGPANGNGFPTDGISDDRNNNGVGDGVPDYYPTLYPNALNDNLVHDGGYNGRTATYDAMPFPYLFPGMYSKSVTLAATDGALHMPNASITAAGTYFNHSPLEFGDSLPTPNFLQTWWGFPTWKETASLRWQDPLIGPNSAGAAFGTQVRGLSVAGSAFPYLVPWLPPIASTFSDGAGNPYTSNTSFQMNAPALPQTIWEDDLIMTGVRSFDVKAFDPQARGYADLGYLNQYTFTSYNTVGAGQAPAAFLLQGFGHEGRIPPLPVPAVGPPSGSLTVAGDYRYNPQGTLVTQQDRIRFDVGDASTTTMRLRRVFDTWSTAYMRAPFYSWTNPQGDPNVNPNTQPLYPSFPPPYPAPLRGIQIQIRVTDPQNEHVKILTIRQDFTDKL